MTWWIFSCWNLQYYIIQPLNHLWNCSSVSSPDPSRSLPGFSNFKMLSLYPLETTHRGEVNEPVYGKILRERYQQIVTLLIPKNFLDIPSKIIILSSLRRLVSADQTETVFLEVTRKSREKLSKIISIGLRMYVCRYIYVYIYLLPKR